MTRQQLRKYKKAVLKHNKKVEKIYETRTRLEMENKALRKRIAELKY